VKLTKSKLKQIIKEELGLGEAEEGYYDADNVDADEKMKKLTALSDYVTGVVKLKKFFDKGDFSWAESPETKAFQMAFEQVMDEAASGAFTPATAIKLERAIRKEWNALQDKL